MMTFDHWKLACRRRREVARYRAYLKGLAAVPGVYEAGILHDHDGRCCRREPWPKTAEALLAGVPGPAIIAGGLAIDE
jgi:hypothetical protein